MSEMSGLKLSASNIGWQAQDDAVVHAKMKELGYTGLEIAPTRWFSAPAYAHIGEVPALAQQCHADWGFVIPSMQSILNGRTENLFDPEGAQVLLSALGDAFAFAKAAGCKSLVFGCPRNRSIPEGKTVEDADAFFIACAKLARAQGVQLALETVPTCYNTNFLNTTADTFAYVKRLGVEGLSVNLDVGAMLTNGESFTDFVAQFGGEMHLVSHVHISAPGLEAVEPAPLHEELAVFLRDVAYQGFVSVEMKTTDAHTMCDSLAWVAKVFA